MTAQVIPFAPPVKKKSPYPFTADFERGVVTRVCSAPSMFSAVGSYLDEDSLRDKAAKLALRAAKAISRDAGGVGPSQLREVLQRIRRWMGEGIATQSELIDVNDLFDDALDLGLPDDEVIIREAAPILRRIAEKDALDTMLATFQKKGDLASVSELFSKASRIGVFGAVSASTQLGASTSALLEAAANVQRLEIGLPELDDLLGGGVPRGTLNVWVGSTGGGKSMGLVQNTTGAAFRGMNTAFATLELSVEMVHARLLANLTGYTIDDIMADHGQRSVRMLEKLAALPGFGEMHVRHFSPKTTNVSDIVAWVRELEAAGTVIHQLVIDYADKLTSKNDPDRDNTYQSTGNIYEDLLLYAQTKRIWVWTGSQAQRRKDRKETILSTDDVSDSINKSRTTDLMITLNPRDDNMSTVFNVAKNRLGKCPLSTPPLPVEFECARIGPIHVPSEYADALRR